MTPLSLSEAHGEQSAASELDDVRSASASSGLQRAAGSNEPKVGHVVFGIDILVVVPQGTPST
jgi:hypothetical protein